ncbi:AMP-binding protein [Pseudonocardia sp. H11422]|uniref:AMP-binding protein n=1 Tax=Pseudonocardia sp. H11422 TaxID=2835866 RepID=UPI001BDC80FC|nr:AMP-binding protein [Pseudonocardia sp. H11422]
MIVTGPSATRYPWEPITIAAQLERTAAAHGDAPGIVFDDRRMTWREVRDAARAMAKGLLARGIGRGDHVAVWMPNHPEWLITWFATCYTGSVVVPVNTRYKPEEVRYILRQSDARLLIMVDRFLGIDYAAMLRTLCPPRADGSLDTSGFPELGGVLVAGGPVPGTGPFDELTASGADISDEQLDAHAGTVRWDDPTIVVYTSGTTGHPKGAVHSHAILRNECSISEWLRIDAGSRILNHMPFFHVAGCMTGVLPGVITGAGLVLMDHWAPRRALELIEREQVTMLGGIPTHFIDLLSHPGLDRVDTSSLRTGWIGGASVPREVVLGAIERLGLAGLLPVYGMTETTSVTTFPRMDDPPEVVLSGRGVPVSDFEVRVVDGAAPSSTRASRGRSRCAGTA